MTDPLTAQRILEAAEEVLRRYGPQKATVVDVARALGVSHGSVYRHFASKAALREAIAARWLHAITEPLVTIVEADASPEQRLRDWVAALAAAKRKKVGTDPEMFANYTALVEESRTVVAEHLAELAAHVGRIVEGGIAAGDFAATDPAAAARAILDATARFHHPAHAHEWDEGTAARLAAVLDLTLDGLRRR